MQARRSNRYNTSGSPAQRSLSKKHATLKATQSILKKEEIKIVEAKPAFDFKSHEAAQFIKGSFPSKTQFKKFATLLYRGLFYSVNNLKGPSE